MLGPFGIISATAATAARFGTEKLEGFADNLELAALLAGGLVVPRVELETTFDVARIALGEILLGDLGLATPESDIHESGVLLLLALFVPPDAVDGEPELGDSRALGRVTQFRIPREVPDEHDFVEIGHNRMEGGQGLPGDGIRRPG